MDLAVDATSRIEVSNGVQLEELFVGLEEVVFGAYILAGYHGVEVRLLPDDDVGVLECLDQLSSHLGMELSHFEELLLDEVNILSHEVLVVLKAFGFVIFTCVDCLFNVSFLFALDHAEGLTE